MRQADKQQLITTGKVVKIFKPNFDGHQPLFPRIGRESGLISDIWLRQERLIRRYRPIESLNIIPFPPNIEYLPFDEWDKWDGYIAIQKMTINEIIERYPLTKEQVEGIKSTINKRKSAGIETAIKELKDLFCKSFKRK